MRPLVRLLVRHGVTYPVFATALKRVFLDAAIDELRERAMAQTDSAVSLLSGVHRRDVRTLTRASAARARACRSAALARRRGRRALAERCGVSGPQATAARARARRVRRHGREREQRCPRPRDARRAAAPGRRQ
jgi:hypothetical protein